MFMGKGESLCRNVRGMLSEYIDNRLGGEKKSLVEHHLETCEACSKELESLKVTVQLLHRVPEVSVPRSFAVTVPQTRRESAFGPASLRWLRPAMATVAIALVVLLTGDFLGGFGSNAGVNLVSSNLTLSPTSDKLVPTPVPTEPPIMVSVPGVMGQMSLSTARAVGYTDYTIISSVPPAMASQPESSSDLVVSGSGLVGTGTPSRLGQPGPGWPLRQTEIGLGATVFVLLGLIIFARRQRAGKG